MLRETTCNTLRYVQSELCKNEEEKKELCEEIKKTLIESSCPDCSNSNGGAPLDCGVGILTTKD